jgi:hypothetical protein
LASRALCPEGIKGLVCCEETKVVGLFLRGVSSLLFACSLLIRRVWLAESLVGFLGLLKSLQTFFFQIVSYAKLFSPWTFCHGGPHVNRHPVTFIDWTFQAEWHLRRALMV